MHAGFLQTVSWQRFGAQILIGVRIQVSSNVGLKALDASESYRAETLPSACRSIGSLSYALVLVIQLMLNSIKTVVFYDSDKIDRANIPTLASDELPYQIFFEQLSGSFERLEFVPVSKGRHMETLRKKLAQLVSSSKTNEIQRDDLQAILRKFAGSGRMGGAAGG